MSVELGHESFGVGVHGPSAMRGISRSGPRPAQSPPVARQPRFPSQGARRILSHSHALSPARIDVGLRALSISEIVVPGRCQP